ncbi:MAG: sugar phosphate isomerase/epimerase family protein [Planctomycetaceae bacterium]
MKFALSSSRRVFLQSTSAAAAVVAAGMWAGTTARGAGSRAGANRGRIFKANKGGGIGKTSADYVTTLNEYKRLGFDGIEGGSPDIMDIPALQGAIAETGVPVHGVVDRDHWKDEFRLSSPNPEARERGRKVLEQAIKDAHAIGASTVLLVPGKVTGPEETHDQVWERSIVEVRKVLPVASRYGIRVLIENVWNGFCETPELYRDYVDAIGSPWVGAYFDIGNCRKFGPAEQWIRTLGKRIIKLDVKDWGMKNSFCRLGEGDVDWDAVRAALAEIEFTGWATREGPDKSLEDTAQLINELLDL